MYEDSRPSSIGDEHIHTYKHAIWYNSGPPCIFLFLFLLHLLPPSFYSFSFLYFYPSSLPPSPPSPSSPPIFLPLILFPLSFYTSSLPPSHTPPPLTPLLLLSSSFLSSSCSTSPSPSFNPPPPIFLYVFFITLYLTEGTDTLLNMGDRNNGYRYAVHG